MLLLTRKWSRSMCHPQMVATSCINRQASHLWQLRVDCRKCSACNYIKEEECVREAKDGAN